MKDNSEKWKPLRRLLFLLPAVLVAALIAYTLPNTQPVLAAVPELLEYEPTPTPEPTPKPDREAQRAEAEAKHADPTAGRKATVASFTAPSAYRDGSYTGSAQGFGGMITVSVTIRDGRIAAVQVTSAPGETEPYFSKAKTVTGRIVSAGTPNVDTVSGATFSSAGILNATKQALKKAAAEPSPEPTVQPTPVPSAMPKTPLRDGDYIGVGEGYGGDVVLKITVKYGRITAAEVLSADDETPAYYNRAAALLPQILEQQTAELDAISGATYSSRGILDAAKSAIEEASHEEAPEESLPPSESPQPSVSPEPTESPEAEESPSPIETPEPTATPEPRQYQDGEYTATGWCEEPENFRYEMIVTVTIEEGLIRKVSVSFGKDESEEPEENDYFIN